MADFFVSYNSADAERAGWIAHQLKAAGFSVRFAPWELKVGDNIAAWMTEATDDSDRMIAVCSPDYFDPKARYSEMERLGFLWADPGKFAGSIINVVARPVQLPKLFRPFMRIDLTGCEEAQAQSRLIGAITGGGHVPAFASVPTDAVQPTSFGHTAAVKTNSGYSGFAGLSFVLVAISIVWADMRSGGRLGSDLYKAMSQAWGQLLLLGTYLSMALVIGTAVSKPGSRRWLAAAMHLDRGGQLFRTLMGKALDGVDSWFSQEERERGHDPNGWKVCWSPRLLEWCLFLAIFYPLLSVFVVWAINGRASSLGAQTLPSLEAQLHIRLFTIASFVMVLLLAQFARHFREMERHRTFYLVFMLAILMIVLSAQHVPETMLSLSIVALATGISGALSIVLLVSVFMALARAELDPEMILIVGGSGVAVLVLAAFLFRDAEASKWTRRTALEVIALLVLGFIAHIPFIGSVEFFKTTLAILFFAMFAFFLKSTGAFIEYLSVRTRSRITIYSVVVLATLSAMVFLATMTKDAKLGASLMLVIFLPFLNAVFDFLSLGLTRYCMRQGMKPGWLNTLKWSLVDLLTAAALFAALLFSTIILLHYVRSLDGTPLASLNAIFKGIATNPQSYWWLYMTFFSTLIPTLVHLGIASFSFVALAPAPVQRAFARWIGAMDDNGFANLAVRYVLPVLATAALVTPFVALCGLGLWLAEHYDNLGWRVLRIALDFAGWLDPANTEGTRKLLPGER